MKKTVLSILIVICVVVGICVLVLLNRQVKPDTLQQESISVNEIEMNADDIQEDGDTIGEWQDVIEKPLNNGTQKPSAVMDQAEALQKELRPDPNSAANADTNSTEDSIDSKNNSSDEQKQNSSSGEDDGIDGDFPDEDVDTGGWT